MKKKNNIRIYSFLIMGLFLILTTSCKKEEDNPPEPKPSVTDIEGNVYNIVTIGDQTWMAENLKTTRYNDDNVITLVTNGGVWTNLTAPAYCWYDNDDTVNNTPYGVLYNWYTVNTGKLCPAGWHVPTDDEWTELVDFLGGEVVAGGKLKEAGAEHWLTPNTGANNESGFTARPGGYRNYDGEFYSLGENGNWWSTTEENAGNAWYRSMFNNISDVNKQSYLKQRGFSVRCVKD